MMRSRVEVEFLVHSFDRSLERVGENLSSVNPEEWSVPPPGGERTIRELVIHLGECYLSYGEWAFYGRGRERGALEVDGLTPKGSPEQKIAWLRASHAYLREGLARCTDADLDARERRGIVESMTEHGLYHAGEINHIRALLQGNDAWQNEPPSDVAED